MGTKMVRLETLEEGYIEGKQTYNQLALRHGLSVSTLQRRLSFSLPMMKDQSTINRPAVILMDCTYFGRNHGIMVFKDAHEKKCLLLKPIKHETVALFKAGIKTLIEAGVEIKAIVCDGKRGLFEAFQGIPVQMCQFHQRAIIRRYLTQHPKLEASIELKKIVSQLTKSTQQEFQEQLNQWSLKWNHFLNERSKSVNPQGKETSHYTHKKLRSAYLSLKRNMPYLFTFEQHAQLSIPNTTNMLEGTFSLLKNRLRCHNGLSSKRRLNMIIRILQPIIYESNKHTFDH